MNLASAPEAYSKADQAALRDEINRADRLNVKRGQDIEMGNARLIFTSPNGTRYGLSVSNAGASVWTAV